VRLLELRETNTSYAVAMLYVEKDLSAIVKAIFDKWDVKKDDLNHKILYCADARVSPDDIIACIERGQLECCGSLNTNC
jgi:hypothetical protein